MSTWRAAVADQVGDQLDVILDQLEPARLAHLPEAGGMRLGIDQGGGLVRAVGVLHGVGSSASLAASG
jgi:hypothetical protein